MYPVFENGSCLVRVDFHLHTRADKEFRYAGEPDRNIRDYVSALKAAEVGVGVITNHNKFDPGEFIALHKAAVVKARDCFPAWSSPLMMLRPACIRSWCLLMTGLLIRSRRTISKVS